MEIRLLGVILLVLLATVHLRVVYNIMRADINEARKDLVKEMIYSTEASLERELHARGKEYLELLGFGYAALVAGGVVAVLNAGELGVFEAAHSLPLYSLTLGVVAICALAVLKARIELYFVLHPRPHRPERRRFSVS